MRLLGVLTLSFFTAACAKPGLIPMDEIKRTPQLTENAILTADAGNLHLRVWTPDGTPTAVILALHGFNDHSAFFEQPGRHLAAQGILSYAYDQRGFGRSPHWGRWAGVTPMVDDLHLAIKLLRTRHPRIPFYVLGASMGGAVTLVALTQAHAPPVDGVILSAPAVWSRNHMPFYQRWALWLGAHTFPRLKLSGKNLNIRPSDNVEMLRALSKDPLVIKKTQIEALWGVTNLMDAALAAAPRLHTPALILYGAQDEVIPAIPVRQMIKNLERDGATPHKIAIYDSGWHMLLRDLQAPRVLTDIVAWIKKPGASLPSGADHWSAGDLKRHGGRSF